MLFPFRWSPLTSHSSKITFSVKLKHSQGCFHRAPHPLLVEKTSQVRQSLGLLPWCGRWTFHVSWISTNLRYQPSTPPNPPTMSTAGGFWWTDIFAIEAWFVCCWFHPPRMLGVLFFLGPFWLKVPHISTALDENSGAGDIYSDQFGEHSYPLRFVCFAAVQEHPIFLVDTAGISMRFSDDVPGAREALPQNRGRVCILES